VAAASTGFDAAPGIDFPEDVFAIFVDLKFDYGQPTITRQRDGLRLLN
jgi:hypothetical protein